MKAGRKKAKISLEDADPPLDPATLIFLASFLSGVKYSIPVIGILATLIGYCILTLGTSSWVVVALVIFEIYLISAGVGRLLIPGSLRKLMRAKPKE